VDGKGVGAFEGLPDGSKVGTTAGLNVGSKEGRTVGINVGLVVGANVTQMFESQLLAMQSASEMHDCPIAHPPHDVPPQSMSVSSLFRTPSMHVADVGPTLGISVGLKLR
jgi:hypothetical protein